MLLAASCVCAVSFGGCAITDADGNVVSVTSGHDVSFESNGGSSVSTCNVKVLVNAPKTVRTDYLFDGWYLNKNLTNEAKFPLSVEYDITLYAKWLRLTDFTSCTGCDLKCWTDHPSSTSWQISPKRFNLEKLAEKEYYMSITVSYTVSYAKDYTLPIGYGGAPEYDVSILNSKGYGTRKKDLETSTSAVRHSIVYTQSVSSFINEDIFLIFSTYNIQNIVYFRDISISYKCF